MKSVVSPRNWNIGKKKNTTLNTEGLQGGTKGINMKIT